MLRHWIFMGICLASLALFGAGAIAQQGMSLPPNLSGYETQSHAASTYATPAQVSAAQAAAVAAAPVQSVNSATGDVVVPTLLSKAGTISSFTTTNGVSVGTWAITGGTPFQTTPTCVANIVTSDTTHVFSAPILTAVSTTSVSFKVGASLIIPTIAVGALTLFSTVPAGTSLNVLCLSPS